MKSFIEEKKYRISEGTRLYRYMTHYVYIKAHFHQTWAELFKTEQYKKATKLRKNINRRIQKIVSKEFAHVDFDQWEIFNEGPRLIFDMKQKRRQKYYLVLTKKGNKVL